MTNNPAAAIRLLITYAICIPLAMLVGYLLCNPLDFGTLGFFGLVTLLLLSPIVIKYHYPLMVVALASPIFCFFLKGNPPLWQVATILCLGVAIIERTLNSEKRFISVPVMTWPLIFILAVTIFTAEMTGGIGLAALGTAVTGGKKYIAVFIGVAIYFALVSQQIPKAKRNLFVALYFLSGVPQFVSDLFPFLPSPLNYINLLIPPSSAGVDGDVSFGTTRLGCFGISASVVANFMLAKYGLKGVINAARPLRFLLFFALLALTLVGGFRIVLVAYIMTFFFLFFLEGLHRTRMVLVFIIGGMLGLTLLLPFAHKLPFTFQRALSVIPMLQLDPTAVMDADGSKKWREEIWADTWPKVPQYLLLGKGYALTAEDQQMMGLGTFANTTEAAMDKSFNSLAISSDYHNGPLSTLMPFGIWGAIGILWLMGATLYVLFRNYKYGDLELKTVNTYLLVTGITSIIGFFFIFGAYSDAIGGYTKLVGFSIALNWAICGPKAQTQVVHRFKPKPAPGQPQPLPV
jgi:hypothetical protein